MPQQRGPRTTIGKGIYRDNLGCAAVAVVGSGPRRRQREKRFPKGTDLAVMRQWQADERAALLKQTAHRRIATSGTLAADIAGYLPTIASRACAGTRGYILNVWGVLFGDRSRASLTDAELQGQLEHWHAEGSSAGTLNQYITSLTAVYRFYKDPPPTLRRYREPDPIPRALTYRDVEDLLRVMPPCPTRACLRVMAYTGLPFVRQQRLRPDLINLAGRAIYLEGRRKGAGTAPQTMPLTSKGVEALREFMLMGMAVPKPSSMRMTLRHAIRAANVTRARTDQIPLKRPYDFRHTFGTWAYLQTRDIKAVAVLLDCSEATATRYALGAVHPNVSAIVAALEQTWTTPPPAPAPRQTRAVGRASQRSSRVA